MPGSALARQGSLMFAAVFLAAGVGLPYFPVWLGAGGLPLEWIGIAMAIPPLVRILAAPAISGIADRTGRPVAVLAACFLAAAAGYALMGLAGGLWPVIACIVLVSIATAPTTALADAMTSEAARRDRGFSYARVRIWGSVSFIAGNIAGGLAVGWHGPGIVIALMAGAMLLAALTVWPMRRTEAFALPLADPSQPDGEGEDRPGRSAALALAILVLSLLNAAHAMLYGFSTIVWTEAGIAPAMVGPLWAIGVIAEIALFYAVGGQRWSVRAALVALAASTAFGFLRWTLAVLPLPTAGLMLLQATHAATFGLAHLAGIALIAAFSREGARARAQGYAVSAGGLLMAFASAPCGWLYARYGAAAFLAMNALVAVAALGLVWLAALARREGFLLPQPASDNGR